MKKYIVRRIAGGLVSAFLTVVLVMGIIYTALDRNLIFASDSVYLKLSGDQKTIYTYRMWEKYGYLDYVSYGDYLSDSTETKAREKTEEDFAEYYSSKGYTVCSLDTQLFAYKNTGIPAMIVRYFSSLVSIDNINKAEGDVGERKLTFTLYDPAYGGDKFSPAIIGNGTEHKYLLYFDNSFPYIHQNFISINLGVSYSINRNKDVSDIMTDSQGTNKLADTLYPSGYRELSADNLHSAVYVEGSLESMEFYGLRYTDDYTGVSVFKNGFSKLGYSFIIGIIAVIIAYVVALPMSLYMAVNSGKALDRIGMVYIAFMTSVPALAYIFIFKALGNIMGLPVSFNVDNPNALMLVMPVLSISIPQTAAVMKWNRRFAKDQMNCEYVEFAKSLGFDRNEILHRFVLKNAAIPIIHSIPAAFLGAFSGAIITERVYAVPGIGNLFTQAINSYDNSVITGLTLFYALLSVAAVILGDVLMASADPRISLEQGGLSDE